MAISAAKGDQGLGKWEIHAKMVRLVRELTAKLDGGEELEKGDEDQIMNIVYQFQAILPKKVQDDLLHG